VKHLVIKIFCYWGVFFFSQVKSKNRNQCNELRVILVYKQLLAIANDHRAGWRDNTTSIATLFLKTTASVAAICLLHYGMYPVSGSEIK